MDAPGRRRTGGGAQAGSLGSGRLDVHDATRASVHDLLLSSPLQCMSVFDASSAFTQAGTASNSTMSPIGRGLSSSAALPPLFVRGRGSPADRKSTRLNSSH